MVGALSGANAVASPNGAARLQPRLVKAAHEFEAQLMKELLQPMTGLGLWTGEEDSNAGGNGTWGEFAAESLAGALSTRGGVGIANRIVAELSHSGNGAGIAPVINRSQIDTGMNSNK